MVGEAAGSTSGSQAADLDAFLATAGRSLADAQRQLVGGVADVPTKVAIAEAELEVKALVETTSAGTLAVRPVSSQEAVAGRISPGTLSSFKIRYVAVAGDLATTAATEPRRSADEVIAEVQQRGDVVRLHDILGGLQFQAIFVPSTSRWLITVTDPDGRTVREVVLADDPPADAPRRERTRR